MKTVSIIPITDDFTPLQRHVARWLNEQSLAYSDGVEGVLQTLCDHGDKATPSYLHGLDNISSFYKQHKGEIDKLVEGIPTDEPVWYAFLATAFTVCELPV